MNVDLSSPVNYISLFSGAGGLDLSIRIAMPTAKCSCYVEIDVPAAAILASRLQEGSLDDAPVWSDITTFDGTAWRGRVDGLIGGFPCTDLSVAGQQAGILEGNRSGLWFEYARIIREVQPRWVFVENVPPVLAFPSGGIVLGELNALGFDAEWMSLRASDVGAPPTRESGFSYWPTADTGMGIRGDRSITQNWGTPRVTNNGGIPCPNSTGRGSRIEDQAAISMQNWPTPNARDDHNPSQPGDGRIKRKIEQGWTIDLNDFAPMWTTPQTHDSAGGSPERVRRHGTEHGCANLADDVTLWPTPIAQDTENLDPQEFLRRKGRQPDGAITSLNIVANLWQTPATDSFRSRGGERKEEMGLDQQARMIFNAAEDWATPSTRMYKGSGETIVRQDGKSRLDMLDYQAEQGFSLPALPTETHGQPSSATIPNSLRPSAKKKLNSSFVGWMMGLPSGWISAGSISSEVLETWLSRCREHLRSLCS